MEIYLVTSGDYSDYSVNCAFADKELAEKFVERVSGTRTNWYQVETFTVLEEMPEYRMYYTRNCRVYPDGTVSDIGSYDYGDWDFGDGFARREEALLTPTRELKYKDEHFWQVSAQGYDLPRVEKILYDEIASTKAMVLGL